MRGIYHSALFLMQNFLIAELEDRFKKDEHYLINKNLFLTIWLSQKQILEIAANAQSYRGNDLSFPTSNFNLRITQQFYER